MTYYTQLIFIKEGKEEVFHQFEDRVLPLLEKYNGKLLVRWRRTEGTVIASGVGDPYEVHLVSFPSAQDFTGYVNDPERQHHLSLKDESVAKVVLIEGRAL